MCTVSFKPIDVANLRRLISDASCCGPGGLACGRIDGIAAYRLCRRVWSRSMSTGRSPCDQSHLASLSPEGGQPLRHHLRLKSDGHINVLRLVYFWPACMISRLMRWSWALLNHHHHHDVIGVVVVVNFITKIYGISVFQDRLLNQ